MKTALLILCFWLILGATQGLKCRYCDDTVFEGEPYRHAGDSSCFDNPSQLSSDQDCDRPDEYCLTSFELVDGLANNVGRSCENVRYDPDSSTDSMPTHDECSTTIYDGNTYTYTEITHCYYACNDSDYCNDRPTTRSLKVCSTNCSRDLYPSQGYCDYLTGSCVCYDGYSGVDCSVSAGTVSGERRCVQCNSETDDNCENPTASQGTTCGNDDGYCSVSRIHTINKTGCDSDGEVQRTTFTRGCTSESSADVTTCKLSSPVDSLLNDYTEYTCTSTCDSNNCNVGTPDDFEPSNPLHCLQCSSCDSYLPSRSLCPVGSTHCYSRVEYYISDNEGGTNQDDPSYNIISHERGCATQATENPGCEKTTINVANLTKVTCQESCQENGCNDGWPARPKCIQCSETSENNYQDCLLSSKRDAERCSYPYEEFCYSTEKRVEASDRVDSYFWEVRRDCSYKGIGTACTVTTNDNIIRHQCNNTCTEDGCNIGIYSHASKTLGNIATMVTATLIASSVQRYIG